MRKPTTKTLHVAGVTAIFFALTLAARAQIPDQSSHQLLPAWTRPYSDLRPQPSELIPISLAIGEGSRCVAIAGGGEVDILDVGGNLLWKWRYRSINKFITAGPLAISPHCDSIALGGDSGYKNVWIAEKNGHTAHFGLASTPLGLAFDRSGKLLAVGTGGGGIMLYGKEGNPLWKTSLPAPCCLPSKLSFSEDNSFILILQGGSGLLRLDGSAVWTAAAFGMSASRNMHTLVNWDEPNHGPGPGIVTVLDESGKELWSKFSQDPTAVTTPEGDKIVARVAINQHPTEEDMQEPLDTDLQIFSRSGDLLKELTGLDGTPLAISPDGEHILLRSDEKIEVVDLNGAVVSWFPERTIDYDRVIVADDFSGVLVLNSEARSELRWYKLR